MPSTLPLKDAPSDTEYRSRENTSETTPTAPYPLTPVDPGSQHRGSARSAGDCPISDGSGVLMRVRRDPQLGAGGRHVQPDDPAPPEPLKPLDLDGAVVTADTMRTQAGTAADAAGPPTSVERPTGGS